MGTARLRGHHGKASAMVRRFALNAGLIHAGGSSADHPLHLHRTSFVPPAEQGEMVCAGAVGPEDRKKLAGGGASVTSATPGSRKNAYAPQQGREDDLADTSSANQPWR